VTTSTGRHISAVLLLHCTVLRVKIKLHRLSLPVVLPLQSSEICETAAVNMAAAVGILMVQRNTPTKIKT
jgi:hypothetical protein